MFKIVIISFKLCIRVHVRPYPLTESLVRQVQPIVTLVGNSFSLCENCLELTVPRMRVSQTGQLPSCGEHLSHDTRCPQGMKTALTFLSAQTLHVFASLSRRFSSIVISCCCCCCLLPATTYIAQFISFTSSHLTLSQLNSFHVNRVIAGSL